MSTRLDRALAGRRKESRKGLIIYMTAGMPDRTGTIEAVRRAEEAGADVIELGLPFSDPMADGPVIQTASVAALRGGMTLVKAKELVHEIRRFSEIPLVGMGYVNNMLHYGFDAFVEDFRAAGMDGVILPDVPHEEAGEMRETCAAHEFPLMEFITPGTTPARMQETCASAAGFIYCVSNNGVTGVKQVDYRPIGKVVKQARAYTKTPLAVGFGIGSPEAAVEAAAEADAVIVGSAVVRLLLADKPDEAAALIAAMRRALDAAYHA